MKPQQQEQSHDQGAFFDVLLESTGTTDPLTPRVTTAHFVEHPEGVFPEAVEPTEINIIDLQQNDLAAAVHAETKTRNRHRAQLGKHSPVQRPGEEGGDYLSPKVGDYLPDFGPVTYGNFDEARTHAEKLEAARQARGSR